MYGSEVLDPLPPLVLLFYFKQLGGLGHLKELSSASAPWINCTVMETCAKQNVSIFKMPQDAQSFLQQNNTAAPFRTVLIWEFWPGVAHLF